MRQRLVCASLLACVSLGVQGAGSDADQYPSRPIRIVDGFPPGGSTDFLARLIGPKLTERFGQPVVVENRPGAGGNVGTEYAARANPDGYTLMAIASTPFTASRSLYRKLGYDPLKDFSFVCLLARGALVLVAHPSLPVKSLRELIALARSQPGAIRYGSGGVGANQHLTMELLKRRTGMDLLHVPYKGGGLAINALLGGEIETSFAAVIQALPMIKAKRLNALAVSSAKRNAALPGVPTAAESGVPGFDVTTSYGIVAPAGTPAAVVKLLNTETQNILRMEDIKARLAEQALEIVGSTPDQFRAAMEAEVAQWARVIKDANITAN